MTKQKSVKKTPTGHADPPALMKKIVHVTFDMGIGGAEQVICNLIENTDTSKYEVSVLCIDQPVGPFGMQLRKKGFQITALNRKPGFDISLIRDIRRHITCHKTDVLHCHQYTPYVYGLLAALFTRCRVVFTEHGRFYPDLRKPKRILLNPFLSLLTDSVTAISWATREALVRFENFPRHKIKIVYNGIDDSEYLLPRNPRLKTALEIPNDAFVLGTVARLDPIKNQKMMIRALELLGQFRSEIFLLIIGDGPERENLEEFASELGLASHVIFTGFREDAAMFYKITDIFLLTSFSEGTAMTLLEAMASGLPCIATDVGGNPEIVMNGETGFIIPSRDEKILAEKIRELLGNDLMRKRMGKAGRKRFEENFTAAGMTSSYEAIYEGIGN